MWQNHGPRLELHVSIFIFNGNLMPSDDSFHREASRLEFSMRSVIFASAPPVNRKSIHNNATGQ